MIKFFNSLGHKKEVFKPLRDNQVSMYVCGPTVYDVDHFGHARTFVIYDCVRRFLMAEGFKVKFVSNITDVGHLSGGADFGEDKILKKAKEENTDPFKIARLYEQEHFRDMAAINVLRPNIAPRATEHIAEIIEFVQGLIKKGYAYETGGNVYFDVSRFSEYGKLSGRKVEELIAGSRVENDPQKKHPEDFALWKKAPKEHLMQWDSPWGRGYPGWHIECSLMAKKYLGDTIDIHGGAVELVFPHHENEIAQSEALNDKRFVNFFLHSGLVTISGAKMAKSTKNFITIKDLLKKYNADTIRLAILKTHWRRPLDYTPGVLEEARKMAVKIRRAKEKAPVGKSIHREEIKAALEDDFNTPQALSIIFNHLDELRQDDFHYLQEVFGLKLAEKKALTVEQEKLVDEREQARKTGDFQKSDQLRREMAKQGIILEDTKEGTKIGLK